MKRAPLVSSLLAACLAWMPSHGAQAFCGFYVGDGEERLYSNATLVVMMREGTRTVLSMQNDYEGPVEDFAMVVPVPVVLREGAVRTLPREIFSHVDRLTAPRLVEYWEEDPCPPPGRARVGGSAIDDLLEGALSGGGARGGGGGGAVRVEARFAVGEYDVVILSADESTALETWLVHEGYRIPVGARAALRPYVEAGMKFFVARVDASRARFAAGRAVLSPLRFHYDAPELSLPIRLGLLSSRGEQDLIVHVISREGRFEVANRPNVAVPTNRRVAEGVRDDFGTYYERLFQLTLAEHPGAVVTEYAWETASCDPCPTPALLAGELATLGADVLPRAMDRYAGGFTVTRLHYRYRSNDVGDDLVFRQTFGLVGGVGRPDRAGRMERGARRWHASRGSSFQARYAILHAWDGPMECASPVRGRWGGDPTVHAGQSEAMHRGTSAFGVPAPRLGPRPRSPRPRRAHPASGSPGLPSSPPTRVLRRHRR